MTTTLNPILLKELRQAVRSRFVSGALLVFLLALLVIVAVVLLVNQGRAVSNPSAIFSMGSGVAAGVYISLALVALLFLPAFTGIRLVFERNGEQLDLQYATTLEPARIIDGKMLACGAVFLQFAGVALPFLVLSFMLRGVNLGGVLLAFGFLAFATAWINYLALLVALLPLNRIWRALFGLALAGFLLQHVFLVIGFSMSVFLDGSLDMDKDFWTGCAFTTGGGIVLCAVLRVVAISFLMPPAANRARPIRACLTVFWVLWAFLTAGLAWLNKDADIAYAWIIPGTIIACFAIVMAASESPGYPRRIRREIPAGPRRVLAFPFFSGAPSGVAWALGLAAVTLGIGLVMEAIRAHPLSGAVCSGCGKIHGSSASDENIAARALLAFLVIAGHAFTVRLLWRYGLRRYLDHTLLWVIVLLFVAVGGLLPLLAQIGAEPSKTGEGLWNFGSVLAAFFDDVKLRPLLSATGLWVLLASLPFLADFGRELRDFRRLEPEPPAA